MLKINTHQAKTHISRYLARVAKGESIILCNRNVPVAEIRPLPPVRKTAQPIGLAKGRFTVAESFFEPLPEDLQRAFAAEP